MKQAIFTLILSLFIFNVYATDIDELEKVAAGHMSEGNFTEAMEAYKQCIALITDDTTHSTTYGYAAICAQQLGDNVTAKAYLIESINRGVEEPMIYDALATIAKTDNDIENQLLAYNAGAECAGIDNVKYLLKLGGVYKKQKDADNLMIVADKALAIEATNPKALEYKGTAYQYQKNMSEANKVFTSLYDLDNENVNANIFLGNYNYQVGISKLNSARKKYEKIAKPSRMEWHDHNVANTAIMTKHFDPAIQKLEFVYATKPMSSIKKMLFTMYTKKGAAEKAKLYAE